mgnify:CR=1 FL=1
MPVTTTKSHKATKTGTPGKPRQRKSIAAMIGVPPVMPEGSSPVESPSSLVPVATASVAPDSLRASDVAPTQAIAAPIPTEGAIEPIVGATSVPTPLPREKQPWYRPPDSKFRKQAEKIAVHRAAGRKAPEIAKRMGTTEGNIRHVEYIARKNGWYDDDGEPVDLEADMAMTMDRKLVRNIDASLDGQMTNWQTHEMTLELMKRRKVINDVEQNADPHTGLSVVAIRIEMPAIGAGDQTFIEENVGGTPAYLEGEVAESPDGGTGLRQAGTQEALEGVTGAVSS